MTHQHAVESLAAERYLLDEMSEIERYAFEAHFFDCEECADDMRLGSRLRRDAQAIFPPRTLPHSSDISRESRWRRPAMWTALPWAAAAVVTAGLIYQMSATQRIVDETRVLAPVALRPATRGAVPTVTLPETAGSVALALEVNWVAPGSVLEYRLTGEYGATVGSGRAEVPAAGTQLLLLVPSDRLTPGETFVVTLTDAGSPSAPASEYRFNVGGR